MQPENDTQAVRRVLARAGITAAALTLSLGAAAPAALAAHGSNSGKAEKADSTRADHAAKSSAHASSQDTDSTGNDQGADDGNGGTAQGGEAGDDHGQSGEHGKSGDHGQGNSSGSVSGDHNPPGNNGTVKIHDVAGDLSHHNVPHVDCDFWVPMWGFDSGQQMTVSFAGQAPTGKDAPVTFTALDGTTLTSPDQAGGGNDYDGELGFTTTAESLQSQLGDPQPQQGYHVKMTVATGEPGGYKYKVFWINCPGTTGGGGENGGGGDNGGGGNNGGGGGELGGGGGENGGTAGGSTTVLGERITRGSTPSATAVLGTQATAPAAGSLPFTGAEIGALAAAAATALGGGVALTVAGRRRRNGAQH